MRAFVYGLFPTGFAFLLSFALARWGFENIYYVAPLLPIFMVFYIALAWLTYLRRSGRQADERDRKNLRFNGLKLEEDKFSNRLRYLRDEKGPIFKNPRKTGLRPYEAKTSSNISSLNAAKILLWSACQIGIAATILYHWFGIGASYYR